MQRRDGDGAARPAALDDLDHDLPGLAPLAEASRHPRGEEQILVPASAVEQGQRPLVTCGAQVRELLPITVQVAVLAFLAPDDELEVRPRPEVAPDLEQHDVVEVVVALAPALPEIGKFRGVLAIGQEAAAPGGLGVVGETEVLGKRHLRLARTTVKIVQALAVDPALAFGQRRLKPFCAQGPQQPVPRPRLPRHDRHRVAALRHGPLPDHFSGHDEVEAALAHPVLRASHHEALAIEARIEVRAVAVLWIEHDRLVLIHHIDKVQLDAELFRHPQRIVALRFGPVAVADGVGVALDAEAGEKVEPLDPDPLLKHDLRREHRIKPAGDQCDRFA